MSIISSILKWVVGNVRHGQLTIIEPNGRRHHFDSKSEGPRAEVRFLNKKAYVEIVLGGSLGFAKAYIDGYWETPDLDAVLLLAAMNIFSDGKRGELLPSPKKIIHQLRHNSRHNSIKQAKRNISAHYDIGNDFYKLWLDKSQTYSCAVFEPKNKVGAVCLFPDVSVCLDDAQSRKYDRLIELAELEPGMSVLDICCGWGGMAIEAAKKGCQVVGVTLSDEQKKAAENRIKKLGLDKLIEIKLQDYREVEGKFDRIISIGMYEHVGHQYWQTYFDKIQSLLKSGGKAVIHGITIRDDLFPAGVEYLSQYIFPGGELPSPAVISEKVQKAGLETVSSRFIGPHYAQTLKCWSDNFERTLPQVKKLGFDDKFIRMWRYYYSYCIAGFKTGRMNLIQTVLVPTTKERSAVKTDPLYKH